MKRCTCPAAYCEVHTEGHSMKAPNTQYQRGDAAVQIARKLTRHSDPAVTDAANMIITLLSAPAEIRKARITPAELIRLGVKDTTPCECESGKLTYCLRHRKIADPGKVSYWP